MAGTASGYDLSSSTFSPGMFPSLSAWQPKIACQLSSRIPWLRGPLVPSACRLPATVGIELRKTHKARATQVEYAGKAVENSGTAIGLRCKDGVILAVEKIVLSKLLVPGANKRIGSADLHVGIVSA